MMASPEDSRAESRKRGSKERKATNADKDEVQQGKGAAIRAEARPSIAPYLADDSPAWHLIKRGLRYDLKDQELDTLEPAVAKEAFQAMLSDMRFLDRTREAEKMEANETQDALKDTNQELQSQIDALFIQIDELHGQIDTLIATNIEQRQQNKELRAANVHLATIPQPEGTPGPNGKRSAKIPDPEKFGENKEDLHFDQWRRRIQTKLRINADHFPNSEHRLAYLQSRIKAPAAELLEPYLEEGSEGQIHSVDDALGVLEQVYGDPYKAATNSYKLKMLKQSGDYTDFNVFTARFFTLIAPMKMDDSTKIREFLKRLTFTMADRADSLHYDSFAELVQQLKKIDQRMKERGTIVGATRATTTKTSLV